MGLGYRSQVKFPGVTSQGNMPFPDLLIGGLFSLAPILPTNTLICPRSTKVCEHPRRSLELVGSFINISYSICSFFGEGAIERESSVPHDPTVSRLDLVYNDGGSASETLPGSTLSITFQVLPSYLQLLLSSALDFSFPPIPPPMQKGSSSPASMGSFRLPSL